MESKIKLILQFILLGVLMYFPIFAFLDTFPIRIWDESRLAINAYEMFHNHNYLITYFEGNPDMWSTKPPLLIWLQVICMKLFGINELAIRLPSAFAALFTCIILLLFSLRYIKSFWFGYIVAMVLITTQGYIALHATRTGDYDSLLTFFTTASGLSFFIFCETKNNKYLYLFFLISVLAVYTKSVTGLIFIPAIVLYAIIQKQLIPLLKNKHFYFGLLSFLVLVFGYYLLREQYNPGYIDAVQKNELGGRYLEVLDKHSHGFWYYIDNLIGYKLSAWILLVPCGIAIGLLHKDKLVNRITQFSSLMAISFLLIISFSQTKLEWYDVPTYPFFAILIGLFIYFVFSFLENAKWLNKTLRLNIIPFIFLLLIFITPYKEIIEKTYKPKESKPGEIFNEIGYFLQDAVDGKQDVNNKYLLYVGYYAHNLFYINILNDNGVHFSIKDYKALDNDDIVIFQQAHIKKYMKDNYHYEVLEKHGNVLTCRVIGTKNKEAE